MGRPKVQLKKIEDKTYSQITFAKRKKGLIKKAYELSTLCDTDVALIVFSPSGKVIIFDGKRRVEETLRRYIDLPHHERGRVANQEMVYRLATEISAEADLWHQLNSFCSRMEVGDLNIQLEEIQNEIDLRNAQLEDVEKQLEYFLQSSSRLKSRKEIGYHERILEAALQHVSLRKLVLQEKASNQIASQTMHPQTASASNFMTINSNYGFGWPQQHDHTQFLATSFANPIGFKPFKNEPDPFAEMLPSSMAFHGIQYPIGNEVSDDYDQFQASMAFRSAGHPIGNAESDGSTQFAPSMAFHGARYLAGNAVNGGSDQFDQFCSRAE